MRRPLGNAIYAALRFPADGPLSEDRAHLLCMLRSTSGTRFSKTGPKNSLFKTESPDIETGISNIPYVVPFEAGLEWRKSDLKTAVLHK
jgi:hypothetical protein